MPHKIVHSLSIKLSKLANEEIGGKQDDYISYFKEDEDLSPEKLGYKKEQSID